MTVSVHKMKKRVQIDGQFIAHRREMRESPAWAALPWNARRVLDQLELEHMAHGGAENGHLICTYAQLQARGLRGPSIAEAINACEALGFIEVTKRGAPSRGGYNNPSTYRLTYLGTRGDNAYSRPTEDWQRIKTAEQAAQALVMAKAKKSARHVKAAKDRRRASDVTAPATVSSIVKAA